MQNRFHSKQQVFDGKGKPCLCTTTVTSCVWRWHRLLSSECKYEQSDGRAPLAGKKSWYFHSAVTARWFGPLWCLLWPVPTPVFVCFVLPSLQLLKKMLILKVFVKPIQLMYSNVAWINCTSVIQKLFLPPSYYYRLKIVKQFIF